MTDAAPTIPFLERLTFDQFRVTAQHHDDLRAVPGTPFHGSPEDYPTPVPGRTYAGSNLCMAQETDGRWWVEWGRASWETSLESAKADLYGIYVSEMAAEPVQAYLRDTMPANEALRPEPPSLDQLTRVYTGWMLLQGLDLGCAHEALVCRDDLTSEQRQWLTGFCERWEAQSRAEAERSSKGGDDQPADAVTLRLPGTDHPRLDEWRLAVSRGETTIGLIEWAGAQDRPH